MSGLPLWRHRDVWVCALAVTITACCALWRLDLLWPSTAPQVPVVDTARTAYVAKNLIEGNGYTTNDLPASLVEFYDRAGRLHDERWLNADRFPFAAYAIAALYGLTGRRDVWTGVILYNLIAFVACFIALYVFTRNISGSRAGGMLAVALALLHNYTYVFLFMKDADMLLLSVFTLAGFQWYLGTRPEARSSWRMAWLGTVLAWSFLARPNVGGPFLIALLLISLVGLARALSAAGAGPALRCWVKTDVIAAAVAALWLLPFLLHTLHAWNVPFFSANVLYQPMLGTRFGMGTDTWWRYVPEGFEYSIAHLWREARSDMVAKFTTAWLATLRTFVSSYFVELALALAVIPLRASRVHDRDAPTAPRLVLAPGLGGGALVTLAVFAVNFAVLPLYSYKHYSWRHYLGFVLPLVWVAAACTALYIGRWLAPVGVRLRDEACARPRMLVALGLGGALLVLLLTPGAEDNLLGLSNALLGRRRWPVALLVLVSLVTMPVWRRWSGTTLAVIGLTIATNAFHQPQVGHKEFTHVYVPASPRVWSELRRRAGLVASFAHQTLVPWNTGRRNVLAPEFLMNLYEMNRAHRLLFEDIYIESPKAARATWLFRPAAPGFEGYERIVRYRDHLPGYRLAFHEEAMVGNPRFGIAPWPKSSTVYTLADRAELERLLATPTTIPIGDEASVVHTAHGFGGYYTIDGRRTVAATDATRARYTPHMDRPWEDTSVTFFVADRAPSRVTVQLYAVGRNTFTFFWNLDLDAYTPDDERARHQVGQVEVAGPGWQSLTLTVPARLPRKGLNKLGFRATTFTTVALCGAETAEVLCARLPGAEGAALLLRAATHEANTVANLSMLLAQLDFELAPR